MKCCICEEEIEEKDSHNAEPVREGRCCGFCNFCLVIPERVRKAMQEYNA